MNLATEFKFVVVGSVGSGKTTAIKATSEIPVVGTDVKAKEAEALHRKDTTTISLDYGVLHIGTTKLHLYGTPGQRRFDFMIDILLKGANAMLILIDNGCANPLGELEYYLNQHQCFLDKHPCVIAVTHLDDTRALTTLADFDQSINRLGFSCPVVGIDARNKNEVIELLAHLLTGIKHLSLPESPCNLVLSSVR